MGAQRGYLQPGGWLSADMRMRLVLPLRSVWLESLSQDQKEAFDSAQGGSG